MEHTRLEARMRDSDRADREAGTATRARRCIDPGKQAGSVRAARIGAGALHFKRLGD